ncbi:MAG: hypothetical protein ABL308_09295 [Oceanicaulis sp.]
MRVSSRYAAVIAAVAGSMMAAAASAQHAPTPPSPPPPSHNPCCGHPGGPVIHPPSVHIGGPSIHVGGPNINVGVNVNSSVNVNVSASANAVATATAGSRAGAGAQTFIYSGGGYVGGGYAPAATALTGLRLAGSAVEIVEEERTRLIEEWRVVRAVCVDDSGTPHPASRPDPDERVHPDYDGEIFRCMSGTALQATLGWREDGRDAFDGGEVISCEKGEALRHGAGGRLYCATEEARRNCNERSLLRLHGPGVKLIYLRYEERYMESYERRTERSEVSSMTLMLDGGVGGYR